MNVVPYLPVHLYVLLPSQVQPNLERINLQSHADALSVMGEAYTVIHDDEPIAVGGLIVVSDFRAKVWAIMGEKTKGKMRFVTDAVRKFLDEKNKVFERIEIDVKSDFDLGKKWAEVLGFEYESTMVRYAHGQNYDRYRRLSYGSN